MTKTRSLLIAFGTTVALLAMLALPADATHAWGTYHWSRTANPFALQLGDNVSSQWDAYLNEAASDWSASTVLNTAVVPGGVKNVKRCPITSGRIEVCNASYGNNGWLGVAGIAISGGHITGGYVKLNDTYFSSAPYNSPAWKRFVTCQEIGHGLGLDHTDETFTNANDGTCMDYTNNPSGPPSNEHPNAHDFEQLVSIYTHLDTRTTAGSDAPSRGRGKPSTSRVSGVDRHGNGSVTWILWVT
jgi:hypothetical protein